MTLMLRASPMARNIALYPWFRFSENLLFWQATWFLYFQNSLSAAEAILLYAVFDIAATLLEVPSGYMSDVWGRRRTLIVSAVAGCFSAVLLAVGSSFAVFALGQILLGASKAFSSGTDSALIYESLAAEGRSDEVEAHELRGWRYAFAALAMSAVIGGGLALWSPVLPFWGAALAFVGVLAIAVSFCEPPKTAGDIAQGGEWVRLGALGSAFRQPVLIWLFALSLLMYVFSHIPFVFGQPFILEALTRAGYSAQAPLVSGVVSATMMALSVVASLYALRLRRWMGLPAILLLAFAMQVALAGVLAVTNAAIVIVFLFLRMVPDSLSWPFIVARVQPLLSDGTRATYLSLKSFAGRLVFAATLGVAALSASEVAQMPYAEIRAILLWYTGVGLVCLGALAIAARGVGIDNKP